MDMNDRADIFTHVHQGIRRALFQATTTLAQAVGDPAAKQIAHQLVEDALLFITRHGENEDALLLPLLDTRVPEVAMRMRAAHQQIETELQSVRGLLARRAPELYLELSLFVAHYLEHMYEEELVLEPQIRVVISDAELADHGQKAVTRIDPSERLTMLRLMLPAMPIAAAQALLNKLPAAVAHQLVEVDARLSMTKTSSHEALRPSSI